MGTCNSQSKNLFFTNIKGLKKTDDKPFFRRINSKDKEDIQEADTVYGTLQSIKFSEEQYDGKTIQVMALTLIDANNETDLIKCSFTQLSRNILNCLLSMNNNGTLEIVLKKNKKGFATAYVKMDKEDLKWFFSVDECKTFIDTATLGGKTLTDSTRLNNMLIEKINEKVIPMLNQNTSNIHKEHDDLITDEMKNEIENNMHSNTNIDNDLPF